MKKRTETAGHPLFEHIGKRVFPTDVGRELHKTTCEIFDDRARFDMTLASLGGLKSSSLSLAVVTTAKYFAPRLLGRFCERHPAVEASLKVCNRAHIIERLAANEDDFYILGQPPEEMEVEAEAFLDNPLVAVASRDHPLAGKARIPLHRFAEEPFLLREPGSGTRAAMERLFAEHGLKARGRMGLESNESIKQAIMVHLGVSILSRHTIPMELASGHLYILDVEGLPIARSWYIVNRKGKALSGVARAFRDCLREYTAKPDSFSMYDQGFGVRVRPTGRALSLGRRARTPRQA